MKHEFDNLPNRRNTHSYKWDIKENELPLWVADMDFKTCPAVISAVKEKAEIGAYGYTFIPDEYFFAYQSFWKKRHHIEFDTSWMIYTSGVVAAMSSIVRSMTNAGDKVVVLEPVYNIFYNSILNNKRDAYPSSLIYKDGHYSINFEDLEEKFKDEKTSLLIFCNPHNPVGKIYTYEELKKVGDLARKYNVTVLSDEIHCDITDPGKEYIPFYAVPSNQDVAITAISCGKAFNLAGMQSACIVIKNPDIKKKVERAFNNDEVAEPNFFAIEANIAALTKGEDWLNELNEYIYQNKVLFRKYVSKEMPKLHVVDSEATYLLWVDVSKYGDDSNVIAKDLREKTGLIVSAGNIFGASGKSFIRINLATSKANILDALERMKSFFK